MDSSDAYGCDENRGISTAINKKRLRDRIEVEELQLMNEKLQRRLQISQEEYMQEKQKTSQLIHLLEKQNDDMRKANNAALEGYYAEKSALRKRLLQLENEVDQIKGGILVKSGEILRFWIH